MLSTATDAPIAKMNASHPGVTPESQPALTEDDKATLLRLSKLPGVFIYIEGVRVWSGWPRITPNGVKWTPGG